MTLDLKIHSYSEGESIFFMSACMMQIENRNFIWIFWTETPSAAFFKVVDLLRYMPILVPGFFWCAVLNWKLKFQKLFCAVPKQQFQTVLNFSKTSWENKSSNMEHRCHFIIEKKQQNTLILTLFSGASWSDPDSEDSCVKCARFIPDAASRNIPRNYRCSS